jgi:hypothetical protein
MPEEFANRWRSNRFPLCAGVLSPGIDTEYWLTRLSNVARLCVNGDPSIEYISSRGVATRPAVSIRFRRGCRNISGLWLLTNRCNAR